MVDWYGPRNPRWRVELLDSDDAPLRMLEGVKSGSVEIAAQTELGVSGQLVILDRGQEIDWMQHRVRITYDPGIAGADPWPVATMLLSSPRRRTRPDGNLWEVETLGKLIVLDEDEIDETYSLAAGTQIIPKVVELIVSAGEHSIAVTPSTATLASQRVWPVGTKKRKIVNDLLESAGYWSVWTDGLGQFRVEPYVDPGERQPSFTFAAGKASIHTPEHDREQDLAKVPNRYIVVGQGDDTNAAPRGVASNDDPDSPYGYQARGNRWVTASEEGAEVENDAAATALAKRRLRDAMAPVARRSVTHAIVPLNPNDVVVFRPRDEPDGVRATVQRMSVTLEFDSLCTAEWRELL